MIAKAAVVEGALAAVTWVASSALNGTAETIVLWAAAGAGVLWFWANVLRPSKKVLARTAKAVEALEDLPEWRKQTDKRLKKLESESEYVHNGVRAIIRELEIEDSVRRLPPELWDA